MGFKVGSAWPTGLHFTLIPQISVSRETIPRISTYSAGIFNGLMNCGGFSRYLRWRRLVLLFLSGSVVLAL